MSDYANSMVQLYVKGRERGWSFERIADEYGITPEEVYREYTAFVQSQEPTNEDEQRLLQLKRLERLIDKCWELVEMGSVDHMKITLTVIKEISKLLGLHKGGLQKSVQVIDNRQVLLVNSYVEVVTESLKKQVLDVVGAKKQRELIDGSWNDWLADAAQEPLKQIEQDRVVV